MEAHDAVRARAQLENLKMATTMTLAIAVWPRLYVVQVGDSRCYYYWDGKLKQITRDQTVAQYLVDTGAMPPEQAARSPFSNVLSSSIGGEEARPEVALQDITPRGCVVLVCSDGLTKHVSDAEIAEHLRTMTSSEQATTALLELALQRGGSDNITIVTGRARPR
jgi:protein phosphatase